MPNTLSALLSRLRNVNNQGPASRTRNTSLANPAFQNSNLVLEAIRQALSGSRFQPGEVSQKGVPFISTVDETGTKIRKRTY